jgi:Ca2+-transporting ATPase
MGLRVLGVGKSNWKENKWPTSQQEFTIEFLGLMAFQDPPKDNITQTLQTFYKAGIDVKMITGDYSETAMAIAKQISFAHENEVLTGDEVLKMDMPTLREKVKSITIFARMFPDAKLKVIQALKENGEVVAMTGDGVNDGPALKAAHIGIAMGKRGSELAKATAALILTDDDLWNMTDAVAMGRKIYDNLKKAIQYIVSIHIPIFLIVALPLFFKWDFTTIFTPIHVIFLELIMGPTCSIVYENEPIEPGTMLRKPLKSSATFLSFRQLIMSIAQGLFISAGCLGIGYYFMNTDATNEMIRTVIFITLLFSNIFLTLFNRSTTQSIIHTIRYKNRLVPIVLIISLVFILIVTKFSFAHSIFNLSDLNFNQWILCVVVAFVSTSWVEVHRFFLRRRLRSL